MAITYNRKPVGVSIPSSSDVGQSYFNHFNWKGINQNRNFLVVDQETFADANNVYVDDEGLLKSRLPVKFKHHFSDKEIEDVKVFDNLILCAYTGSDHARYIGIIEDGVWTAIYKISIDCPLKAFKNGNYLYIFTNLGSITYNSETKTISDTLFYDAITRIYTGLNFDFYESENLMSSKNRYQYVLFPTAPSIDNTYTPDSINANAYGKTGDYVHYLNEDKIHHQIQIDENKKFLNVIHQPLFYTTEGFAATNYFGAYVPTWIIRNNIIYRFNDGIIEMASISDGVFETLYKNYDEDEERFIKIKIATNDIIYIITDKWIYTVDVDNVVHLERQPDVGSLNKVGMICDIDRSSTTNYYREAVLYYKEEENELYATVPSSTYNIEHESPVVDSKILLNNDCPIERYSRLLTDIKVTSTGNTLINYYSKVCSDFIYTSLIEAYFGIWHFASINGDIAYTSDGDNKYDYSITIRHIDTTLSPLHFVPKIRTVKNLSTYDVCVYDSFSDSIHYGILNLSDQDFTYGVLASNFNFKIENKYFAKINETYNYNNGLFIMNNTSGPIRYVYGEYEEDVTPLRGIFFSSGDYWMLHLEDKSLTLSNYRLNTQMINVEIYKSKLTNFDVIVKKDKIFVGKDNNLYIGEIIVDPDDDKEKLYFKKDDAHILDENITGLHPISDTELAIFTRDSIWYNINVDNVYYYRQSKIVPNLKNKSELITLPDSTTTLMPSNNGIIALSYQNFVNTTEQSTVNISQDLTSIYDLFKNDIRSLNWKQYTIFYESDNNVILIYDNRLTSWWRWTLPVEIYCLFVYDNLLYCIANGSIYEFSNSTIDYFDLINTDKMKIDWYVESQKLYLGANNNYKHISNITLFSVQEGGNNDKLSLELNVKNYRKNVNNGKSEDFDYKIDVIRTYVKRVNYAKVCEFQYKLSSNSQSNIELDIPLALSNVSVKYKIGGQVR